MLITLLLSEKFLKLLSLSIYEVLTHLNPPVTEKAIDLPTFSRYAVNCINAVKRGKLSTR